MLFFSHENGGVGGAEYMNKKCWPRMECAICAIIGELARHKVFLIKVDDSIKNFNNDQIYFLRRHKKNDAGFGERMSSTAK